MLDKIKLLLGVTTEDKDALLNLLLDNAIEFANDYCRVDNFGNETILTRMVVEDYNRIGAEGTTSNSFNGVSESYSSDYSEQVYKNLNKHRKIKTL